MNTVTVTGLDREKCALIVTLKALDELIDSGSLTGGDYRLSPDGLAIAKAIEAAGFEFNPGEMESIVDALQADA